MSVLLAAHISRWDYARQLLFVPLNGSRVGDINYSETRLPEIPLPWLAILPIGSLDEVAILHTLFEQRRQL